MSPLLQSLQLGPYTLPNRLIMAPLTRARAGASRTPNELMVEYYRQRSGAGLILTEATSISPQGVGYANTPGIWSEQQVEGWKKVTHAVHEKGGRIFMQLWHVGRISHSSFLNGERPVAPSAIPPKGHVSLIRPITEYEVPRALEESEVVELVQVYRKAAINAKEAGFDGVELHAANGYLIDQFLQDSTNHRTDRYGGSVENRARLLLEVTDVLIEVWGANRVGMHLAPRCDSHDMGDSNPLKTFGYVMDQLNERRIAFVFTRERLAEDSISPELRKRFRGVFIANEGFDKASAESIIEAGDADAVSFGRLAIANPDLIDRFEQNAPLNQPVPETFYGSGREGYTDYPFLTS